MSRDYSERESYAARMLRLLKALHTTGPNHRNAGAVRLKLEAAEFIQEQARMIVRLENELMDAYAERMN